MAIHSSSQAPPPSSSALPSSSHRLPTVSATQALEALQEKAPPPLSTNLQQLDSLLAGHAAPNGTVDAASDESRRGLRPGTMTEIWGPSGSGKTTMAMQLASSALHSGGSVIWVDAATPLVPHRLTSALSTPPPTLDNFHHLPLPTLSHLLTLLSHPPSSLLSALSSLRLVVLDSLPSHLDKAYPRYSTSSSSSTATAQERENRRWASTRRFAVLGHVGAELRRWAATHNAAVVVTSNAVTRGRGGGGAVLVSALGGVEWEVHVSNRIVLFRDFDASSGKEREGEGRVSGGRFAGVTKVAGTKLVFGDGDVGLVVPFGISREGIVDVGANAGGEKGTPSPPPPAVAGVKLVSPVKGRSGKRKLGDVVADSEDEEGSEYGWDGGSEVDEGLVDDGELEIIGERYLGDDGEGDGQVQQEEDESLFATFDATS